MESLSKIIQGNLQKSGIGEAAFAAMLVARANKHISDFMGQKAIEHIQVKKLDKNILHVYITSATWAQEFQFFRYEFLEKIRKDFPHKTLWDVAIQIRGREDLYDNGKSFK